MIKKLTNSPWFYTAIGFIVIVLCWFVFYLILGNSYVLPSPFQAFKECVKLLGKPYFYSMFGLTLLRVLIAFIISLALASVSVLLSKTYWAFKGFFSAVTAVMRSLPTLAVILIIILTVSRSTVPIIVCILSLYPIFCVAIETAFFNADESIKEMCNVYNVPRKKYFFKVLLRASIKPLISELLSGLAFALKLVISAEIIALCHNGLGGMMQEASLYDNTTLLFAQTVIVCCFGLIIEVLSKTLIKRGENESN